MQVFVLGARENFLFPTKHITILDSIDELFIAQIRLNGF